MFLRKALSIGVFSARGFLLNKKLVAFFIFISLSINGFAPSAAEASRYSFVMAAAMVAKNAAVQIFKQCSAPLTKITGNFQNDFFNSLDSTPINRSKDEEGKKEETSKNPCGASGFYMSQEALNKKPLEDKDDSHYLSGGIIPDKLVIDPEGKRSFALNGIIILFLMFIAAILRRKGLEGYTIIIESRENGKRILGLG